MKSLTALKVRDLASIEIEHENPNCRRKISVRALTVSWTGCAKHFPVSPWSNFGSLTSTGVGTPVGM